MDAFIRESTWPPDGSAVDESRVAGPGGDGEDGEESDEKDLKQELQDYNANALHPELTMKIFIIERISGSSLERKLSNDDIFH